MKILFFIDSLGAGGKERRLVELLKGLSKHEDISMELVLTQRDIHYTGIFNLNIKIHYIERKNLKKDPRLFLKFYLIVREFKPDIIHSWGYMAAIYAIPAKILLKIPLINSLIADAPLHVKGGLSSYKLTFPFSDIVLANSKAGLKSYNAPEGKSSCIYGGFDFDRMLKLRTPNDVKKELNISARYVVGMVASFTPLKDYGTYIKAAQQVLSKNRDITFLCVGAGDDSGYRKLVKMEFRNEIKFLGPRTNVESIMNICDVGVLTSNPDTHGEGISNSLMEFMSLGKPVIATDGGGTNELIKDGETGFLVKPKSPEELASKIEYLLDNDKVASSMGEKGRERIKQEFSIEKMISSFVDVYKTQQSKK